MAKTKEELKVLKEEVETISKKLAELSNDELKQVTGGMKIVVVETALELDNVVEANRFIPIP